MNHKPLTPTAVIVLGLLEQAGPSTPYDLKLAVNRSVGNFWSVPHSQLYAEPQRLCAVGYVTEERELEGRRRRLYAISKKGRTALDDWRTEPASETPELRDQALLKLFFGADPVSVASSQVVEHRAKLAEYEVLLSRDSGSGPRGPWQALAAGIRHEVEWVRFWEELAAT